MKIKISSPNYYFSLFRYIILCLHQSCYQPTTIWIKNNSRFSKWIFIFNHFKDPVLDYFNSLFESRYTSICSDQILTCFKLSTINELAARAPTRNNLLHSQSATSIAKCLSRYDLVYFNYYHTTFSLFLDSAFLTFIYYMIF